MKKQFIYIIALLLCVCLVSCDDYVDIKTEGQLTPEETINYRYLLNYVNSKSYALVDLASEDINIHDDHAQYFEDYYGTSSYYRPYRESYKWADSLYYTGETDSDFNVMYSMLYYANVVISEVPESKNGTDEEKQALMGEALVHRAHIFLMLVNIFAKAYDAQTAATDLGIPILTEPTVDQEIVRASVQEVYDQIVSDLKEAINSGMPTVRRGGNMAYPSQAAAYAMLARTYLYMGNYEAAQSNAEAALDLQSTLNNLEDYENVADYGFPAHNDDPEIIMSIMSSTDYMYSPLLLSLSDDLLSIFDTNDLRYQLFTRPISEMSYGSLTEGRAYCKERLIGEARNAGPSVPEMMLIKAECQARSGQGDNAMSTINALREKRFKADDYVALTAANAEDALVKVLEERRRELMCTGGFRWFDLKRLNKDTRFAKAITHTYLDESKTLQPGDDRYQFPFASVLFDYAPELEQNP